MRRWKAQCPDPKLGSAIGSVRTWVGWRVGRWVDTFARAIEDKPYIRMRASQDATWRPENEDTGRAATGDQNMGNQCSSHKSRSCNLLFSFTTTHSTTNTTSKDGCAEVRCNCCKKLSQFAFLLNLSWPSSRQRLYMNGNTT